MRKGLIFIFIGGFLISASQAYAVDCSQDKFKVGDKIIKANQSDDVGKVFEIHPGGYLKVRGLGWPDENFYNPNKFCKYRPTDEFQGYQAGQLLVQEGPIFARLLEIKNFSENGFVGLRDPRYEDVNYEQWDSWVYNFYRYSPVTSLAGFKMNTCVTKAYTNPDVISETEYFRVTDMIKEGFIRAADFSRLYFKPDYFVVADDQNCKPLEDAVDKNLGAKSKSRLKRIFDAIVK